LKTWSFLRYHSICTIDLPCINLSFGVTKGTVFCARAASCGLAIVPYCDRKPIIASGELSSIIKEYDGTEKHFSSKANYSTFEYDWRRYYEMVYRFVSAGTPFYGTLNHMSRWRM